MITYLFAGVPMFAKKGTGTSSQSSTLADTLKVLNRISAIGEVDGNGDQAIADILKEICSFTGWPIAHLYERSKETPDQIVSRKIWHLADKLDGENTAVFRRLSEETVFEDGKGLIGQIAADGEARAVPDVTVLKQFLRADAARQNHVMGFFGFPVTVRGQVVAVAEFFSHDKAELDTLYLELMRNVAGHIARILERERAADLERERARAQRAELRQSFEEHVRGSIGSLSAAAGRLSTVVRQLEGSTTSASEACTSVESLSVASGEASERVRQSSAAIDSAAALLAARLDESVTAAETVSGETQKAGAMVSDLETAAGSVGDIAGVVATITGQIRMLGLNAAIEAVRAGQHGTGFGVVASEIKVLAEQSEAATAQIADKVKTMRDTVTDAAAILSRLGGEGAELSSRSQAMSQSVAEQTQASAAITESAAGSAESTRELLGMSEALRVAMNDVGQSAQALNDVAVAVAQTSESLDQDSTAFLTALDQM